MAVTAKFQADFSSFLDAINKAEAELVDFGKGASNVESKLNRMVDNFSGRKLIQEATLMATAIEKAGGATTLTAKELDSVSAKAAEAADKMHRLGYEVPPGIQKLADATHNAAGAGREMSSAFANVTSLLSAFGITAGIAGIVNLGKAIFADADALTKMHDKTGIAIGGLQILQAAGDDAGNTIEQISDAINKMQVRISGGSQSAVSAISELGISFSKFHALSPDEKFIAVGKAIQNIKDPADQARLATELFGKAGAEVLPSLKQDFDKLKASVEGMSDQTVESLDKAGDALTAFWRREKGIISAVGADIILGVKSHIDSFRILFGSLPDLPKAPNLKLPSPLALAGGAPDDLAEITHKFEDHFQKIKKAAEDAAASSKKFRDSVEGLSFKKFVVDSFPMVGLIQDISDRSGAFREHLDDLTSSFNEYHDGITVAGDEMSTVTIPLFAKLPDVIALSTKQLDQAHDALKKLADPSLVGGLKDIFTGKGFSQLGAALQDAINPAKILNTALGGLLSGGLSSLIGLATKGIGSLFSKLFGNPEKEINPIRQAFVDMAGGLDTLNKKAHDAGLTLDAMLNAKNPEQYQKAIEDLNAAFKFQDDALATLMDTAKKYGFTLEELGPALQRQELGKQAEDIYKDFQVLTAGGLDHIAVLTRMADGVNTYIQNAAAMGVEVPASLQGILKELIGLGLLTDKDGAKFDDLADTGVTFSTTMTEGFKSVVAAVEKLTAAISRGLGTAIANIPSDITVGVHFNVDDPNIRLDDLSVNRMARGGAGVVTQPTLFLAGEAGTEKFAFGDAVNGGGGDSGILQRILEELQLQPRRFRDAAMGAAV